MVPLFAVLFLAGPAAALNADAPGPPAVRARSAIETLPVEARVELRAMFIRYREEVARRQDQGWEQGLLNDAVIEDVDEPFQPARLLEEAGKNRRKELAALEAALKKADQDANEYGKLLQKIEGKKADLESLHLKLAREKGICRDWSDAVWSLLTSLKPEHWSVDDRRRGARPFHTAAVACAPPEDPVVCLAFDPWPAGLPQAYAFPAWDAKEPGGRIPADYFLHGLPEKAP